MIGPRKYHQIKSFIRVYQGIRQPDRVRHVHVYIHIPGDQQQLPFQVLRQFNIRGNLRLEGIFLL